MKLKNKLLPIVAIAATGSVVAPLVTLTSCNKQTLTSFNLLEDTIDDIGVCQLTKATQEEATKEYIAFLKANPSKFAKEYAKYLQYTILYEETTTSADEIKFNRYNVKISEPRFGSTFITYPSEPGVTYPTISFTINYDIEKEERYEGTISNGEDEPELARTVTNTITGTMRYENVPFFAMPDESTFTGEPCWTIGVNRIINKYTYIPQYMTDSWLIGMDVNSVTKTVYDDFAGRTDTDSQSMKVNVDSYQKLRDLMRSTLKSDSLNAKATGMNSILKVILFNYESTYLNNVDVANEIFNDQHEAAVKISVGGRAAKQPVEIRGLYVTGLKPETTFTVAEEYVLPISTKLTESTNAEDPFKDTEIVISKGTPLTIDSDNRITIKSASQATPTVFMRKHDGITAFQFTTEEIGKYASYSTPKTLKLNDGKHDFLVHLNLSDSKSFSIGADIIKAYVHGNTSLTSQTQTKTVDELTSAGGFTLGLTYSGGLDNFCFLNNDDSLPYLEHDNEYTANNAAVVIYDENGLSYVIKLMASENKILLTPEADAQTAIAAVTAEGGSFTISFGTNSYILFAYADGGDEGYLNEIGGADKLDTSGIKLTVTPNS